MARIYKAKFRVESDEVQGPGSWVDFQRPTWELGRKVNTGGELLELCILAWNWTDDEDKPLPLPKDCPGIVDTLPQPEATWLMDHSGILERKEAQKNSSSASSRT